MNVIGCNHNGYVVTVTESEMRMITGKDQKLASGSIVNVSDMFLHYHKIISADKARSDYADSLRAAATVLENTPNIIEPDGA